jgi:hypothetical protein
MAKRRGRYRFKGRARLPVVFRAQWLRLLWLVPLPLICIWTSIVVNWFVNSDGVAISGVLLLFASEAFVLWRVFKIRARIRRWIHAEPPVCAGCEYPLAGEGAACAECGLSANVQEQVMRRYLRRHRIWILA